MPIGIRTRFKKGHPGYRSMLGKKMLPETCLKMSLAKKNNPVKYWLGKKRPGIGAQVSVKLKGTKHTSEQRLKKSLIAPRGENHRWWKGGLTKLQVKIRHSFGYKVWREAVFFRDNYTCVHCGYNKGHILEADHIVPFWVLLQDNKIKTFEQALVCLELWDISNGRTLCKPCHQKTSTYLSKAWRDSAPAAGEIYPQLLRLKKKYDLLSY